MSSVPGKEFVDYYATLGVKPDAGVDQIRRAYLVMAKQHHPDAGGSTEEMQALNQAYRTLVSSGSRAAYDMLHSFHTGTSEGKYRMDDGKGMSASASKMSDEYVDFFIDSVFAEYQQEVKSQKARSKGFKNPFRR